MKSSLHQEKVRGRRLRGRGTKAMMMEGKANNSQKVAGSTTCRDQEAPSNMMNQSSSEQEQGGNDGDGDAALLSRMETAEVVMSDTILLQSKKSGCSTGSAPATHPGAVRIDHDQRGSNAASLKVAATRGMGTLQERIEAAQDQMLQEKLLLESSNNNDKKKAAMKNNKGTVARIPASAANGRSDGEIIREDSGYSGKRPIVARAMQDNDSSALELAAEALRQRLREQEPVAKEIVNADGEVGLEELEENDRRHEETRRKHSIWKCKVFTLFFLVLIGVALGTIFGVTSRSDEATSEVDDASPALPQAQQQPTPAPAPFIIDLPPSTKQTIMEDPASPQAKAYRWIANDPHLEQYVGQEDRLVQRFALATLYYSLEGDNWPLRNGWMDYNTSECDWAYKGGYGLPALEMKGIMTERFVSVILDGAITDEPFDWKKFLYTDDLVPPPIPSCNPMNQYKLLRIHKQNLQGTIPEELSLISSLVVLDMSYNDGLIGSMPTTFGRMQQLKYIMMEETGISGTLPSQLGRMESLRVLSTTGTRFWQGATIPTEMGQLKDLTTLLLSNSGVQGTIPSELGQAHNLTIFDVSSSANDEQKITGSIPTSFGLLSKLHIFTCGNCQLDGTLPSQLGRLASLEMLSIGPSAGISSTIPTSFGGLTSLKYVHIAQSHLHGRIPSELGLSTDLVRLYLMENQLWGNLPSELGRMTNLQTVHINGNKELTGSFPPEVVAGWSQSLAVLNIVNTTITGTMPDSFCSLPGVFEFDCSWESCGCRCVC